MEVVTILRLLLRHRRLIAVGLVLAVLSGVAANRRIRAQTSSGTAAARLLIGPPDGPVNDSAVDQGEELITRTKLLADLMSSDYTRGKIAAQAGIPAEQLVVEGPATLPPWAAIPLAINATKAASIAGTPYVLTVEAADSNPIMTLTVTAPAAPAARKLVATATAVLRDMVADSGKGRRALAAQSLGTIGTRTVVVSHSRALVVAAPPLVLVLWCVAIVLGAGIARRLRWTPDEPAGARRPVALVP